MSRDASGVHAIEGVDAAAHAVEYISAPADSQQVLRQIKESRKNEEKLVLIEG